MSKDACDLERAGRECDRATDRCDNRFARTQEEALDRDDEDVEGDVRRLNDVGIQDQPRDEKHIDCELKPRLSQDVSGESKNESVNNCEASDDRQQTEAFVDRL